MPQLGPFVYTHFLLTQWLSLSWPLLKTFALNGIQCSLGLQNLTSESKPLRMQLVHQHSFIWGCWLKSKGRKQASSMVCWFHFPKSNYNIQAPAPSKTSAFSFCPLNTVCVLWLQFQYWWPFDCVVLPGVSNSVHCQFSLRVFWCHYPNTYSVIFEVSFPISPQPL